jgi:hypothetical protein
MKYVGEKRVMSVKKFFLECSGIKILMKSESFATVSSSGASFLSSRFLLRKKKCGNVIYFKKLFITPSLSKNQILRQAQNDNSNARQQ